PHRKIAGVLSSDEGVHLEAVLIGRRVLEEGAIVGDLLVVVEPVAVVLQPPRAEGGGEAVSVERSCDLSRAKAAVVEARLVEERLAVPQELLQARVGLSVGSAREGARAGPVEEGRVLVER